MSYLDIPRFTFSGSFNAQPSTINNSTLNYYCYANAEPFRNDESAFTKPENFPEPLRQLVPKAGGLSWNPDGVAPFSFSGKVNSLVTDRGRRVTARNPLIGAKLKTNGNGKLVDLDPDQQSLTQLFGIAVTLTLADGTAVFTAGQKESTMAALKVPVLTDLWFARNLSMLGGDSGASGIFQWELDDVEWNRSPAFRRSALYKLLSAAFRQGISMKINTDAYNPGPARQKGYAQYHGRIVGTLGPARRGEPFSYVAGRRLVPAPQRAHSPAASYWPGYARVDSRRKVLLLDLGNSIPQLMKGNRFLPAGPDGKALGRRRLSVELAVGERPVPLARGRNLDASDETYTTWGAIYEIPLSPREMRLVHKSDLRVSIVDGGAASPVLCESPLFIRPAEMSWRMSAGETKELAFRVLERGRPKHRYRFSIEVQGAEAKSSNAPDGKPWDAINVPQNLKARRKQGLEITALTRATGKDGILRFSIEAHGFRISKLPPFRRWLRSQVYQLGGRWLEDGRAFISAGGFSFLVWSDRDVTGRRAGRQKKNPTWTDVANLLGGYAALYPGMRSILNIGEKSVVDTPENAGAMQARMTLPVYDPGYMPVTRDMSPADRQLVLNYLGNVLERSGGKKAS